MAKKEMNIGGLLNNINNRVASAIEDNQENNEDMTQAQVTSEPAPETKETSTQETTNEPNNATITLVAPTMQAKAERYQRLLNKSNRTIQRSFKIDERIANWLENVKTYKKQMGEVRPCLDDLYYDAVVEYLDNHFSELRD